MATTSIGLNSGGSRVSRALTHPAQLAVFEVVLEILERLGSAQTESDWAAAQLSLLSAVRGIESWYADTTRAWKRTRRGHDEPEATALAEEREHARRAIAQLRTVGDALAWQQFEFDRRLIWVLSRNQAPGAVGRKKGFEAELKLVTERAMSGKLAVLHDLTNCLRIGDVSARDGDTIEIFEVKSGLGRPTTAQKLRMRSSEATINRGAPLSVDEGEVNLHVSSTVLRSYLGDFAGAFDDALDGNIVVRQPAPGTVAMAYSPLKAAARGSLPELLRQLPPTRSSVIGETFGSSDFYHYVSFNSLPFHPAIAPRSVYPIPHWQRAALICDYIVYETFLSIDAIVDALQSHGVQVIRAEPPSRSLDEITLRVRRGRRREMTLANAAFVQPLVELLDLDTYAEALTQYLEEGDLGRMTLTFAQEDHTWSLGLNPLGHPARP